MNRKNIYIILTALLMLVAFTGCAGTRTHTATTHPTTPGTIDALDRDAEDVREFISGNAAGARDYTTNRTSSANSLNYRDDLSIDHLTALIGKTDADLDATLGKGKNLANGLSGRAYSQKLYGTATDFDVQYNDRNQVSQIVVNVNKANAARWQRELNARYGTMSEANTHVTQWLDSNTRIDWMEIGNQVRVVFTNRSI